VRQATCRRVVLRRASQLNVCALAINLLCCGPLAVTTNKILQPSPDRIDSKNVAYDDANLHVTQLPCNLAKNQCGVDPDRSSQGIETRAPQALCRRH
jgi:hypothetical protein